MGQEAEHGAQNYDPLPVVLSKGYGVHVWDVDGKRYVDFLSAYSAVNHVRAVRTCNVAAWQLFPTLDRTAWQQGNGA